MRSALYSASYGAVAKAVGKDFKPKRLAESIGKVNGRPTGFVPLLGRTEPSRDLHHLGGSRYWDLSSTPDLTGNYVIELWLYIESLPGTTRVPFMAGKNQSGKYGVGIEFRNGVTPRAVHSKSSSSSSFYNASLPNLGPTEVDRFYYIKTERAGDVVTISDDRGESASVSVDAGSPSSAIDRIYFGGAPYINGNRVIDGAIAYGKITDSTGGEFAFFFDGAESQVSLSNITGVVSQLTKQPEGYGFSDSVAVGS